MSTVKGSLHKANIDSGWHEPPLNGHWSGHAYTLLLSIGLYLNPKSMQNSSPKAIITAKRPLSCILWESKYISATV